MVMFKSGYVKAPAFAAVAAFGLALVLGPTGPAHSDGIILAGWGTLPSGGSSDCQKAKNNENIDALNAEFACIATGTDANVCKVDDKRVCADLKKVREKCGGSGAWTGVFKTHYCNARCTENPSTSC
jgi:hypothetical protein